MVESVIGSLRFNDGDRKTKRKQTNSFDKQNNAIARVSHFFVHFLAVTARLLPENA